VIFAKQEIKVGQKRDTYMKTNHVMVSQ